jgi:Na+/phosphate symporter
MEGSMEERELMQRFQDIFETATPILDNLQKGFFSQQISIIQDCEKKFGDLLISRVPYVEKIIGEKEKSEADKKYVILLPALQTIALAIENLMYKMESKLASNVLFSEKALSEIRNLYQMMQEQFRDTKDYIATRNPGLKDSVRLHMNRMFQLIEELAIVHQNRLITGICMPQASYLYLDITDSLKRIARGLVDFVDKV